MAAAQKKSSKGKKGKSKAAKGERDAPRDVPAKDSSVEELKSENRERLFAFSIPQPPGDPKLLQVPVDFENLGMDFDAAVAKKIGHVGLQLLKMRHMQSGLHRRADLPAVNLKEGLKVLSLVPYNLAGSGALGPTEANGGRGAGAGAGVVSPEDDKIMIGGAGKKAFFLANPGQGGGAVASANLERKPEITGKMSWVMNTTYISDFDRSRRSAAKERERERGTTAVDKRRMAEGSSEAAMSAAKAAAAVEASFDKVRDATRAGIPHPSKKGVTMEEAIPVVPLGSGSEHVLVQFQNDAPFSANEGQARHSVLKSISVPVDDDGETRSVIPIMLPTGAYDPKGAVAFQRYKLSGAEYELQKSQGREEEPGSNLILVVKGGVAQYVDLSTKLSLKRYKASTKVATRELRSLRKKEIRVMRRKITK